MELGFFYDGPLTQDSLGNYYGVALNNSLFSRYLNFAKKIHICMRLYHSDNVNKMTMLNMTNMDFTECMNLLSIKGILSEKKAEKTINSVLEKCEFAVIRLPSRIGHVAVRCCKKKRIPYLIEMVGCPRDSFWNHSFCGKLVAYPFAMQTRKDVYHAPAVIYVTKYFLQNRYPTRGDTIGCSDVELQRVDRSILDKRLKKIQGIKSKVIIGTTAAIDVKFKGQQYIIAALGYLKKQGITNYEYQLVGTGDNSYLKSLAKKYGVETQVKFLGAMPHNQVFEWLDTIDIYVQPSKQEGLPRALVEAMSRGLPAFGANTGGVPELIDPEFIFKNTTLANVKEIVFLIQRFDKEIMKKQAKRNFNIAKQYQKYVLDEKRNLFYKKIFMK